MAGKKKVLVIKDVGGGLRGSTSGLRFNPREAPEFVEEDRNLGRDDSDEKEKYDRKKRKEREQRHKKIERMKHLAIKVPGKKRPEGDNQRNDERLSELTGPASSTGAPLDAATGAKTGTGSAMGGPNIMTGYEMDDALDILKKKRRGSHKKKGKKVGRHGKTRTVTSHRATERHKETARLRRGMGGSTEHQYYRAKGLPANNTKRPDLLSVRMNSLNRRVMNQRGNKGLRQLSTRGRQMKGMQSWQEDMRTRNSGIERNRAGRREGTGRVTKSHTGLMPTKATLAHSGSASTPVSAYATAQQMTPSAPRASYQSGQPRTMAGGVDLGTRVTTSPSGTAAGFGQSFIQPAMAKAIQRDVLAEAEELLRKASISAGDLLELRQLIRELRRMMRGAGLKKAGLEDAEHDDERPSPNAQHKVTSSPTGATEVDPDDDPRYWGAHPIGLLLPRRGHP